MARSSLSNAAARTSPQVAIGPGVHFQTRSIAEAVTADQRPSAVTAGTGLVGAHTVLDPVGKQALANRLPQPVRLKLVRDGGSWTAFTSLDGTRWNQAGQPVVLTALGIWVGLFVTAHHSGQYLTAAFDHVSGFQPRTVVQIGAV